MQPGSKKTQKLLKLVADLGLISVMLLLQAY
jgi:hypothetical protein